MAYNMLTKSFNDVVKQIEETLRLFSIKCLNKLRKDESLEY
ncbi:hypothetical protein LDG_6869 [Legionella drancourtii LLAP12]|uniref:Uncharacterized protein n=1 Tax=Legionella drancourtii LLAP12 TaxID=658187 RepID=G9ENP4_9GAMM|nr:hypothetical protein LDG_6869 [Legionella drancourtii LLAP12]